MSVGSVCGKRLFERAAGSNPKPRPSVREAADSRVCVAKPIQGDCLAPRIIDLQHQSPNGDGRTGCRTHCSTLGAVAPAGGGPLLLSIESDVVHNKEVGLVAVHFGEALGRQLGIYRLPNLGQLSEGGAIPSRFILENNVVRFRPSLAAAPRGPPSFQWER